MKKIITVILIAIMLTALVPSFAISGELPVIRANFPVIVNGRIVDNEAREYPFILCNSVTYFPMTYDDCAFLGLENVWTAESGNVITKTVSSGVYKDFIDPTCRLINPAGKAKVVTTPITVMGERIDNASMQYPILNYNNILYFPLTWDWGNTFGWNVIFTENKILEVSTEGFADSGYFYTYTRSGNEFTENKHKIADTAPEAILYGGYSGRYSPNYIWDSTKPDGYVTLFRLLETQGEKRVISVTADLVQSFKNKGWYTLEEAESGVMEFLKTHSVEEFQIATTELRWELSDILNPICDNIEANYESLYSADLRSCAVPKSEAESYIAAGWMNRETFAGYVTGYYEKKGDYGKAMDIIEKNMGILYLDYVDVNYPDFSWISYEAAKNVYDGLRERYSKKMKSNMVFRSSHLDENSIKMIFDCILPHGKMLVRFDLSYDVVDSMGNVLLTKTDTVTPFLVDFEATKTTIRSLSYEFYTEENPYAAGISNVKISNLFYDDKNNMPMGAG